MPLPRILVFLLFSGFASDFYVLSYAIDLQFIYYNGTVTGTYTSGSSTASPCASATLGTTFNASISVGVNPPWDTNPFFIRFTTPDHDGYSKTCQVSPCLAAGVWSLDFRSASDVCVEIATGYGCNGVYWSDEIKYKGFEVLNLKNSTVGPIQIEGKSGYSVVGDQSTYVPGTSANISNDFTLWQPGDSRQFNSSLPQCFSSSISFSWDETTPFTYEVNFTNTTSTALWTLVTLDGTVNLSFSGTRADYLDNDHQPLPPTNPKDNGNYAAISLDTSDPKVPRFTFANGSRIVFGKQTGDYGEWEVKAVGAKPVRFQWSLFLAMFVLSGFVLFF